MLRIDKVDISLANFEKQIRAKVEANESLNYDPAHDRLHCYRVVATAKRLCVLENGKLEVVMPAAWLRDFVVVAKNDPRRKQASRLSASAAVKFLRELRYPEAYFAEISHAIEAHSFSAAIEAQTLEAKIVQDADRLDGLGAIGIARCFATAGLLKRAFYAEEDAFCEKRTADDQKYTVDHFYVKLFNTSATLQTAAGRAEGARRLETMKNYLAEFKKELTPF